MKMNQLILGTILPLLISVGLTTTVLAQKQPITDAELEDEASSSNPRHDEHHQMRRELRHKHHQHRKMMAEKHLKELDQNGDERVDLSEYLSHAESRFNKLDADGDGYVTKSEARDRHRELRKKHRIKRKQLYHELQTESDSSAQ